MHVENNAAPLASISSASLQPLAVSETINYSQEVAKQRKIDFAHVFGSPALKAQFNDFLNNIFMQLDPDKFDKLITSVLAKNLSYEDTYQELFNRIGEAKYGTVKGFLQQIRSLKVIKETLAGQIEKLLCRGAVADGYLEYGYTGRLIRQLKKQAGINLTGPKAVVNDKEKLSDYIEAGFPRPYEQFVKLNDYAPITPEVQPASRDLVICPIGLHHVPDEKLGPFLKSISDVVRPGGQFIVRDHDVRTRDLDALVNVVHSVFNAATGETLKTEMTEERHFKPVATFAKSVKAYGFGFGPEPAPITTKGDPTDNALFSFTKLAKNEGEEVTALERTMRLTRNGYERSREQTYLTSIEWHLVATAKEEAVDMQKRPVDAFPYFREIKSLWSVFIGSCRDAIRASSFSKVARSEYMLMNFFMLVSSTIELAYRGIALAPLALRRRKESDMDTGSIRKFAEISDHYAEFIKTVPFYDYPFFSKLRELWKAFRADLGHHTLLNVYFTAVASCELFAKAVTSAPLSWLYSGVETGKMHVIVEDPTNKVSSLGDKRIEVLRGSDSGKWKALHLPRYLEFRDIMGQFAANDIKIASIAGQTKVQLKVKVKGDFSEIQGCRVLGEIPILTEPGTRYLRLDVDVAELSSVIKALGKQDAGLVYIHDF